MQHRGQLPDLVLLDASLPDGSGFDLCRQIRKRYSRSKVRRQRHPPAACCCCHGCRLADVVVSATAAVAVSCVPPACVRVLRAVCTGVHRLDASWDNT